MIGRNEGDRLRSCLAAAKRECERLVYVDSDSSDGSASLAESLGAEVIRLAQPGLTAARGRQTGLERLLELWPQVEFVQFVDGDCQLQDGWITAALRDLSSDSRLAAVSGIRSEAGVERSRWSRLVNIEWPRTAGVVLYPGGDSLCRVSALRAVGGWSADLIAGEDPDLGFRLVDAGWHIRRLAVPMTIHDIRITTFHQYWRRAVRSGFAYAAAGWRNRRGVGRTYLARGAKFTSHGLLLTSTILGTIAYWPLAIVALAAVSWVVWRSLRFASRAGLSVPDSLCYGLLAIPVRLAQALGFLRGLALLGCGVPARLIEYRMATATAEVP